jgi:hypothetical protein
MDAMKISAQFAAYVWYTKRVAFGREADAAEFAKANWAKFLPLAHVGLGRLLRRIAGEGTRRLPTETQAPRLSRLQTLTRAMAKQRQR